MQLQCSGINITGNGDLRMSSIIVLAIWFILLVTCFTPGGDKANTPPVAPITPDKTEVVDKPTIVKPVKKVTKILSAADSLFLSVKTEEQVVDDLEWKSLAVTLYCEARGESNYGIAAVADTIRNRVNSNMFPNTYYGVVTQRKQFSCIHDTKNITNNVVMVNSIDVRDFRKMLKISYRVITGKMPRMTYNALFYHTTSIRPYWSKRYNKLGVVGHHIFYTTSKL